MDKKIALVTGGVGGIGTAICKKLAQRGPLRRRQLRHPRHRDRSSSRTWPPRGSTAAARRSPSATSPTTTRWARWSRGIAKRPRPRRHPGELRRHHARLDLPQDDARAVAPGHRDQPHERLQRDAPRDRQHVRPRLGPHHQHLVGQRDPRPVRADQLFRRQGGHPRLHQGARPGSGEEGRHRERDLARATWRPRWSRPSART